MEQMCVIVICGPLATKISIIPNHLRRRFQDGAAILQFSVADAYATNRDPSLPLSRVLEIETLTRRG